MILGRPTNLWLGLVTAMAGLVTSALVVGGVDPTVVATIVGPAVTVLGALIVLIANSAPVLNVDDEYHIVTPKGQPNYVATVAPPPLPTKPVPDVGS